VPSIPDLLFSCERLLRLILANGRLHGEEAEAAQALADEIETALGREGYAGPPLEGGPE
jgi:hypothetical protein